MKKIICSLLVITAILLASPGQAQQKVKWAEMENFHDIMGAIFHPVEKGKFEPIKSRSAELAQKAIAWKNSTAPEGYDKKGVMKNLRKLVKGAKAINKMVQKNAADTDLKEELTELHGVFHEITEKCEH